MTLEQQQIDKEMNAFIDDADKQGLWLFSPLQDLWFSPNELRKERAEGRRSRWAVYNWKMRDPKERASELRTKAKKAQEEYVAFKKRLGIK